MPTLTIDLQDGFDGDRVEISVDGEPRWSGDEITTNLAVSLAASVPLEVGAGDVLVRVALPGRGLEAEESLSVSGEAHLAANVSNGALDVRRLAERPYYL